MNRRGFLGILPGLPALPIAKAPDPTPEPVVMPAAGERTGRAVLSMIVDLARKARVPVVFASERDAKDFAPQPKGK